MEAGFTGDIDAFVGQHRHDPRGWGLGDAGLVGDFDDACALSLGQSVRQCWPDRIRSPITTGQTIILPPALQGARIDPRQSAGGLRRAVGAGFGDQISKGLAILRAGHASSPSWKIAANFFESTSKAAVSASASCLRCSSRSSSLVRRRSCFTVTLSISRGSPRPPIASCFQFSTQSDRRRVHGTRRYTRPRSSPPSRSPLQAAPSGCSAVPPRLTVEPKPQPANAPASRR